jgi:GH24 family phage-related lysozyme (muramidase)
VQDVAGAVASVNQLVTVPLTQNQFDALVDFVFLYQYLPRRASFSTK